MTSETVTPSLFMTLHEVAVRYRNLFFTERLWLTSEIKNIRIPFDLGWTFIFCWKSLDFENCPLLRTKHEGGGRSESPHLNATQYRHTLHKYNLVAKCRLYLKKEKFLRIWSCLHNDLRKYELISKLSCTKSVIWISWITSGLEKITAGTQWFNTGKCHLVFCCPVWPPV